MSVYDDPVTIPEQRPYADRCPGLLTPHQAEDGLLVRLRIPGGQTTVAGLVELSRIAQTYGEGSLQLTSRANLQVRGIDRDRLEAMTLEVMAAGFLPSFTHERVRNVVASPLSGLELGSGVRQGQVDVRPLVADLDAALCAAPALADLPGRFLVVVDDGRGDVVSLGFDLGLQAVSSDTVLVLVGGAAHGFAVPLADAVPTLITLAHRFLAVRRTLEPPPWHVREVALDQIAPDARPVTVADADHLILGAVGTAASVSVPLSLLTPTQVAALAAVRPEGAVVITPWRGLVVPDAAGDLDRLSAAGFVVDEDSAWAGVTACIGAPGCAKSAIDTQSTAAGLVSRLGTRRPRVHLVGCARRCGAPAETHVDLVAPASVDAALRALSAAPIEVGA